MPRAGRDVSLVEEQLLEVLESKACKLAATELGPNSVFSLAEYDYPDRHLLRSFCTTPAMPWSAFDGIRSDKNPVKLTAAQERSIGEDFAKMTSSIAASKSGSNLIAEPRRSVCRVLQELCPTVCQGDTPQRGTTFLLLAAVTGAVELARRCLDLGANPNSMSFLSDPDAPVNQMQHGYSPMFMAVLAGQFEVMTLLHHIGGSVHVYDRWGRSPLYAAVEMGNALVVQWLLAHGAPRSIGCAVPDASDPTFAPPIMALQSSPRAPRLANDQRGETDAARESNSKDEAVSGDTETKAEEKECPCPCCSGRPRGYCGCVDDMFERWSRDRLRLRWWTGRDLAAIAARPTAVGPIRLQIRRGK